MTDPWKILDNERRLTPEIRKASGGAVWAEGGKGP